MGSPAPRGSSNRGSARRYRVALTERSTIVARGEQLELWFVRVNDAWTRVTEHVTATTEENAAADEPSTATSETSAGSERCPSGTIWVRTTELVLEAGTRVLLRQSWPRSRRLSVMSYLKQGLSNTQRFVRERHFVVSGNYRLAPVGRMLIKTEVSPDAASNAEDPLCLMVATRR